MKYKIIAIDLDGTLLDDEKNIPKENVKLLREVSKNGYEIVIATGRRYWSAKSFIKDIDENIVILANNGTIVRNSKEDNTLLRKYLGVEDFHVLLKEGKERGLEPIVHIDNYDEGYDIVVEMDKEDIKKGSYMSHNIERCKYVDDLFKIKHPKVLAVVYAASINELEEFYVDIVKKYPRKYSSHIMHNMTIEGGLLEVMHPRGCKWLSLKEYAGKKGISKEEIITIGDDNNDIQMVKNAGLGIAMKNGTKMIKKAADIVTKKDNNEGGLAYTLAEVLKL